MKLSSLAGRLTPIVWVLIIGSLLIAAVVVLRPKPHPKPARELPPPSVTVIKAEPQTLAVNVSAQGSVAPRRQIDVVSQVAGALVEVSPQFASGGYFAKGATLAQIDPRDYQVAVARARATLVEAEKALATEKGLARQAKLQWRDLGTDDANSLFLRKPMVAAAEAQLEAAKAGLEQAQLNLERTRIQLPFAGRINTTWVDLGQFVSIGSKIATVYDAGAALVRLPLTDDQAALIDLPLAFGKPQQTLPSVTLRGTVAGTPYQWHGKVTRTEASLDPQSRMYYAVVEIPDPFDPFKNKLPLLMGMYVEAEIAGKPLANVMQLPRSVVFRRDRVFSVGSDNLVQEKSVKVLRSDDDYVWIQGDIAAGELLVLERQSYLSEGAKVKPELRAQVQSPELAEPELAEPEAPAIEGEAAAQGTES